MSTNERQRSGPCIRGFSLFELIVVILVFAVLAVVLLDRFFYYEEVAEKTRMEATVSQLRSGLKARMAELMISGHMQETVLLAKQNPFDWLERKPENYRGEFVDPAPGSVSPGEWYFDPRDRMLVYLIKNGAHFSIGSGGKKCVRLKIVYISNRPSTGASNLDVEPTDTVALQIMDGYTWF